MLRQIIEYMMVKNLLIHLVMEQQKLVLFNLQNIWQVFYLLMVLESML